jgi:hypothetical protein
LSFNLVRSEIMTQGQYGHQTWKVAIPTVVPASFLTFNGIQFFEGFRSQVQAFLRQTVNVSTFIANGFRSVQQVTVSNLAFIQGSDANVVITFTVDTYTDISWLTVAEVIIVAGGFAAALIGFFAGNYILIALGITVIIAVAFITATEVFREVVSTFPTQDLTNIVYAILIIGGGIVAIQLIRLLKR